MTKFSFCPNTCPCKIEVDEYFHFVSYFARCALHREFEGDGLLREILAHNNSFNARVRPDWTPEQRENLIMEMRNEKIRIGKLRRISRIVRP